MKRQFELDERDIEAAVLLWLFKHGHVTEADDIEVGLRTNGKTEPPDPPYAASESVRVWVVVTVRKA